MNNVDVTIAFVQTLVVGGLIGGTVVTAFVQFLKSNFIPAQFANKYPRLTTVVTSALAAIALTYTTCKAGAEACTQLTQSWVGWICMTIAVFIIAVLIYNNVLRDKPNTP